MHPVTADELIRLYALERHPEGGWYRETYRAAGSIPQAGLPPEFPGARRFSTSIYFLLPAGSRSGLHRIRSDEVWHFYLGGPLHLAQLVPGRRGAEVVTLGQDVRTGQRLQHVVPAGCWFGAWPAEGSAYAFVGCTVAPGFEFEDFEMGRREELSAQFPEAGELVQRLLGPLATRRQDIP